MSAPRKESTTYNSVEEVRDALYPDSAHLLDLGGDEVLDFPTEFADALDGDIKRIAAKTRSTKHIVDD